MLERLKWLLSASRVCGFLSSSTNENIVEVIKVLLDTFEVDVLQNKRAVLILMDLIMLAFVFFSVDVIS